MTRDIAKYVGELIGLGLASIRDLEIVPLGLSALYIHS